MDPYLSKFFPFRVDHFSEWEPNRKPQKLSPFLNMPGESSTLKSYSSAEQMTHMKCQALFSRKKGKEKKKCIVSHWIAF